MIRILFLVDVVPPSPRYKHLSCKRILTKESDGFHKHPTQHSFLIHFMNYGKAQATTSSIRFWLMPSQPMRRVRKCVWHPEVLYQDTRREDSYSRTRVQEVSQTLPKKEHWELPRNHRNEFPIVWVSCFDMVECFQELACERKRISGRRFWSAFAG